MAAILARLQRGIEDTYRVATDVCIADYVIGPEARAHLNPARAAREQLLVMEADGALELALFVEPSALENLTRNDPSEALHEHNLGDFLLAVEGVSHFIYAVLRARADRPLSVLELELQAEVDKYLVCLLLAEARPQYSGPLRRRLFRQFAYEDDLDQAERRRYQVANHNARRYSASLERRFVLSRRIDDMLHEVRRFYRMSLRAKLDFIAQAA